MGALNVPSVGGYQTGLKLSEHGLESAKAALNTAQNKCWSCNASAGLSKESADH